MRLEITADVGQPLARYLRYGRPAGTAHRQVFLALDAPHGPLTASAVVSVAARALAGAGITGPGAAHRLRHTAACGVQAAGIGGPAIALLLGHESPASTRPYLQADLELKQRALDRTAPPRTRRGRYTAKDELLAFLEAL